MSRVLFLATSANPKSGGIASVNRSIVRALGELGCDQRLVLYNDAECALGADYITDASAFRAWGCGGSRRRFVSRFLRLATFWRPDVVLVDHLHLAVVPFLLGRVVSLPYVLFCHGVEFDEPLSRMRRAAFRSAALRLSNSQFTARRLMSRFPGTAVEPCELGLDDLSLPVPNGDLPGSLADAVGTQQQLGDQAILIVARLSASERYKGHDQLIAVLPEVRRRFPHAQLVIVGAGDGLARLREMARSGGCGSAVLFPGFMEGAALSGLYGRCRLFAMPSRGEGFGLVYLEAMRYAKPCIASRVDGGSEVVQDGVTGRLVDPGNLHEIAQAILNLLADDELSERLGRNGLQRLNDHYQYRHFRDRLRQRLSGLLPELTANDEAPRSTGDSVACLVEAR